MAIYETIENLARILAQDLQSRRECYETHLSQITERGAQVRRLLYDMSRMKDSGNIHPTNNIDRTYEQRGGTQNHSANPINNFVLNAIPNPRRFSNSASSSYTGTNASMNSTFATEVNSSDPNSSRGFETDGSSTLDSTLLAANTCFSIYGTGSTGDGTTSTNITATTPSSVRIPSEMTSSTNNASGATNSAANSVTFTGTTNSSPTEMRSTNATTNNSTDSSGYYESQSPSISRNPGSANTSRSINETTPVRSSESSRTVTIGEIQLPNMILPYCEPTAFIQCPRCHNCIHLVVDTSETEDVPPSLPEDLSFRVREIRGNERNSPHRIADNNMAPQANPYASTPIATSPPTMNSLSSGDCDPAMSTPLSSNSNNGDPTLSRMQISPLPFPRLVFNNQNVNHPMQRTEILRNPISASQQGNQRPVDSSIIGGFELPTGNRMNPSSTPESGLRFRNTREEQLNRNSGGRDTNLISDAFQNNLQECESMLAENFCRLLPIFLSIVDVLKELRDFSRPIRDTP